jgi:hypothetical protein
MPKIIAEFAHAFGSVLDYGVNWRGNKWLESDENIVTSTWQLVGGDITLGQTYNANGVTSVFVSGALAGKIYRLVNTITTSKGRTDSRTIVLSCVKQR